VHEPAWWWVKASNLGGLERPVVRFDLAHVMHLPLYYMGIMAVAVGPLGESIVLVLALVSGNATWFKIVTLLSDSSFWHFFIFAEFVLEYVVNFLSASTCV